MGKVKEQSVAYTTKNKQPEIEKLPVPKKAVLRMLKNLKDNATYQDIMYELYVLEKIEQGLEDVRKGRVIPHNEVKKRLKKWLK